MSEQKHDVRFRKSGMAAPLVLLFLFVIFVYGALLVGLLEIANWIIHAWNQICLINSLGAFSVVLMALYLLATWFMVVFSIAAVPYYFLRARGKHKLADQTALVIIFLLFHIFTLPFILWPMVRNASPKLRAKRQAKLRQMVRKRQRER